LNENSKKDQYPKGQKIYCQNFTCQACVVMGNIGPSTAENSLWI